MNVLCVCAKHHQVECTLRSSTKRTYIQAMNCRCLSLSQLISLTADNSRTKVCWRYLNKIQYHSNKYVFVCG